MAVIVRHRAPELTQELYDQVAPPLIESVKNAPGFLAHVSYVDGDGFAISEVWESQEQHDEWFNATVVPKVPVTINQEVIEVHSFHQP